VEQRHSALSPTGVEIILSRLTAVWQLLVALIHNAPKMPCLSDAKSSKQIRFVTADDFPAMTP
jgi:hypothetical protein